MKIGRPEGQSDVLTEGEVQQIVNLPDRTTLEGLRDYAVLLVFGNTLLRKGEICNLNAYNLVNEGKKKFISYKALKKRSQRPYWVRLRISDEVYFGIKKYLDADHRAPNEPMFKTLGKHGPYEAARITPKAIDFIVHKYVAKAGIKKRITPHSFRATYTTLRLRKHGPRALQVIGQWSSLHSMEPYLRVSNQELENAELEFSFAAEA